MAKRHIPESHGGHPNVTPLIDVVMVLIVFFMLVAKIGVSTGDDKSIIVPKSIQGVELKDMGNTLLLNVQRGQLDQPYVTALINGTATELKTLPDAKTGKSQLVATLQYFRNGDKAKNVAPNDKFKVVIRGDQDMPYSALEPILFACAEAKVKEVAFKTSVVTEEVSE
jgi:biopolymer transport protein ExbD